MSTTMNEIGKYLLKYKPRISIQENITISNYIYLNDKVSDFNPNCLYVCKSSKLPQDINSKDIINLLIVLDGPLPTYLQWWNKYNLILLDENECNIYVLLEKLQDLINMDIVLNHLTKKLIDGISKHLSLNDLISIVYDHIKNPIIITNTCGYLLASYYGNTNLNEPVWEEHIATNYAGVNYLKNIYYDLNFRQSISPFNQPIIADYTDIMNHRMLISPLKKDNFNVAYIYVLESKGSISKIDIKILEILNKILLPLVVNDRRIVLSKQSSFDYIFYYLINCESYDENYIESYIKVFHLDLSDNLFLIYIEKLDNINSYDKLKYLYDILSHIFHNHYIYFYDNKIFILYKDGKKLKDDEYNLLIRFLKENNLKAGISQPFSNLKDFKNACYQGHKAINISAKLNSSELISYYNDFITNNLVFTFIKDNNMNDLIDINLMDFISDNNDEFVQTLKVYCENNGDMQKTSAEIHIHYNTLKYRLQKIKDLYSLDIFDSNYILKLKLSFLALDFLQNKVKK